MSDHSNKPAAETQTDTKVRLVPAPLWAVTALGVLAYALIVNSINSGASFEPNVFGPYHSFGEVDREHPKIPIDPLILDGKKVFNTYCSSCHQATGSGVPGQFPPLAKSDWVNVEGPNRLVRIVLNGLGGPITVNGVEYNNNMMPWRDQLNDRQIAAVLSYIRNEKSWDNKGTLVQPDEVKKIREAIKDKSDPFTAPALLQVPVK